MPRDPQRSAARAPAFDARFPARSELLALRRREFATWLHGAGVVGEQVDDLTVVFSELTANAVAGSPDDVAEVAAHAHVDGLELCIDVRNRTGGAPGDVRRPDLEDPLRDRGRGLMIVRALVDEVLVERNGSDLAVRCRCRLGPSALG